MIENARLVKSIIQIKKRETNHGNRLVQCKDGQNIYTLCGNSRSHIMSQDYGRGAGKIIATLTNRKIGQLTTIPCSNLSTRKKNVLRIFSDNVNLTDRLQNVTSSPNVRRSRENSPFRSVGSMTPGKHLGYQPGSS